MESTSGGVKGYWKSRNILRDRRRRKTPVIQLTDPSRKNLNPRRRFWRIRVKPKLRVLKKAVCYPGWLLGKLRDAYVGMMMKFAGAYGGGGGGVMYGAGMGVSLAPRPILKEYDEKVIVEMYKNMIRQGLVFPADTTAIHAGEAKRPVLPTA